MTYQSVYYFIQPLYEIEILKFILALSLELKTTYDFYQDLLFCASNNFSNRKNVSSLSPKYINNDLYTCSNRNNQ